MAGDDDKKIKKIKKVKKPEKAAEEAPPAEEPAPEPTPAPVPAASDEPDWFSAEPEPEAPKPEEAAPAPAQEEGQVAESDPVAEGAEGDVIAEAPPAPKKKPRFFIHWDRRKPKFYDYNFDYGENYYSPVVGYLDHKNLGSTAHIPRRKGFAERGIDSSVIRKSNPDMVTQNILNNVRSSIRSYEGFQRDYILDVDRKYLY